MLLFGMIWGLVFVVVSLIGVFLYSLNARVKRMEQNYERNSIESLQTAFNRLQDTVNMMLKNQVK